MAQLLQSLTNTLSNLSPLEKGVSFGALLGSVFFLGRRYFRGPYVPSHLLKESDLRGQVVLVTGASKGGIGYETVKSLYLLGATVVMAVRDVSRGELEKQELEQLNKNKQNGGKLVLMKLNLDDLESVKEFSREFLKSFDRLDILVNNAGLGQGPALSKQDIELHFAVNHLGHFLLVKFVKDLIQETSVKYSKQCKIINVSSMAHNMVKNESQLMFHPDKLIKNDGTGLPRLFAYGQSKLCNVLFAKSLARYFAKDPKAQVGCYSLHPGVVSTNVWRQSPALMLAILSVFSLFLLKTPESGAQTQIYVALEKNEKLSNGGYYSDCAQAKENPLSKSEKIQDDLWNLSEELCKEFSTL